MKTTLSVILPCHNEQDIVDQAVAAIVDNLRPITNKYEIILVDDGSWDRTYEIIKRLANSNENLQGIRFTRNFGKEAAIQAGLRKARGEAVIVMDADLQHPPELIGVLVHYWREEGYAIVEAVKSYTEKGKLITKVRSKVFNWFMRRMTGLEMQGASDYKLLDRRVVEQLIGISERNRFFRGLVSWTGFRTKQVFFQVRERAGGESNWPITSLIRLSISAATAFSNIPLQIVTGLGFLALMFSVLLGLQTLYNKVSGNAVSGFTTVIILNLLLNGVLMINLGVIGTYVANVYTESKRRPFFIVSEETEQKEKKRKRKPKPGGFLKKS